MKSYSTCSKWVKLEQNFFAWKRTTSRKGGRDLQKTFHLNKDYPILHNLDNTGVGTISTHPLVLFSQNWWIFYYPNLYMNDSFLCRVSFKSRAKFENSSIKKKTHTQNGKKVKGKISASNPIKIYQRGSNILRKLLTADQIRVV